ncbi:Carboxypeptidase B, partial [Caligus rogercresseyi]
SVSGSKVTWDDYMSYDTVLAFAQVLKKYFPTGVFIDILGQTLEGRDLFVVSLCSSGICGKKPGIWLDAGTHAREWTTISSLTYIMNELIQHRENHEKIVDALDWYFMPVVNPDGYEYSMTIDSNWRKNRAINPGCIGVDINRNFPVKWESGVCDDTFPGLKAFSEVESRLQADFIRKRSSCIKLFNSFHNYGDLILFPWAATNLDYASEASHIKLGQRGINAMSVRSGRDYKIGSVSKVLYLAKGSSMDYYANIGIPYVYTMEIGTSFIPDTKEIIPLAKEVFEFIKTLSKQIILDFA